MATEMALICGDGVHPQTGMIPRTILSIQRGHDTKGDAVLALVAFLDKMSHVNWTGIEHAFWLRMYSPTGATVFRGDVAIGMVRLERGGGLVNIGETADQLNDLVYRMVSWTVDLAPGWMAAVQYGGYGITVSFYQAASQ